MAEKTIIKTLYNGSRVAVYPETETDQVSDMTAFMKTLNKQGTDAAAVKTLLNISSGGDGIPVAAILPWDSDSNVIPPGFLECDGSAISRTEYADLFGVIGTKYGSGDGSTTFNVPDYTDGVFLEGSDTAGTSHAAGLPNIEGSTSSNNGGGVMTQIGFDGQGAFDNATFSGGFWNTTSGSTQGLSSLAFDASLSNAIYGNSDTVQPKSSTTRYLIKFIPSVPESEASAAASASVAQAAAQAAESYAGSAGIPVGTLFPYAGDVSTPPTGFLACDGSAVSRTMYPDLFSVLGTTWGAGDGSTTFNLPRSEDLVMRGASATNPVGTYLSAGLPNIEGRFGRTIYTGDPTLFTGAFTQNTTDLSTFGGSGTALRSVSFNASQSNAIYGNSTTVQPPAACVKFIIKAYDGVTPGSAGIDLSQYASELGNKASRGLDNLTDAGKDRFLGDDNFCIIYPNGGTAANPANVAVSTRYVESNPFPGYAVSCDVEVLYNGEWGWYGQCSNNSYNHQAVASQLNNGNIVLQTCGDDYAWNATYTGSPLSGTPKLPLPCRIKVYKIGKLVNS